jgi:hypothetical protein
MKGYSTKPGFVSQHNVKVLRDTGEPGTDNGQRIYEVECLGHTPGEPCGKRFGVNGTNIYNCHCPLNGGTDLWA